MATVSPIVILNKNTVRRKKTMGNPAKRILSSTSSNSPTYEDKKNKVFVTPNRFEVLQMEEQDNVFVQTESQLASQTTKTSPEPSKKTLPNIVLTNVTDFIILKKDLTSIVGPMGFTCKANRSNIIIRSNTRENWMAIKSYLIEANYEYHSYLPRSSQPFRVVLRHLHHSTPAVDIINYLSDHGHKVNSISKITHHTNKLPLPLFNIGLARNNNNREIFKITKILNTIVKFEYPKRRPDPPQCHNCQKYGHTRNYCHHYPRCVKCGSEHSTDECTKQPEEPAKCANCSGNHTANYKGCQSLKKILNRTKPKVKAKKINKENQPIPTLAIPPPSRRNGNEAPSPNSKGKPSYAEIAANKPPPDQSLYIIIKFLDELKSILNPLLTVLTSLINKITLPITPTP